MRKIIFIMFLALNFNVNAQINLEHLYNNASPLTSNEDQLMIVNFEVSGYRYVRIDRGMKLIDIYNLNHSLLKTISLANVPHEAPYGKLGDILYISENLFCTDSLISFMYCLQTDSGTLHPFTGIYNENGNLLFSDTAYPSIIPNYEQQQMPIYNTPQGVKMILSYNNGQAAVYSLPGTLTSAIQEANNNLIAMQKHGSVSNAYPNPNNGSTKIDYTLPPGVNEGEIVFYNLQGMEVKRFKVDRTFTTLLISTKDIAAGTYYYQLQTSAQNSGGKKMVVIK
jgi:hypothetical protein